MASDDADREKLHQICDLSYKGQAVWWLNAFWAEHQGEAEKLWAYVEKANEIDLEHHDAGSGLDELNAHRLLEIFDETLTVREMRTQLRSVGAIGEKERPKLVPLAHLLLARYKSDWHHFVNAPQGASEELEKAQAKLDACKAAFRESEARAQAAAEALRELEAKEAELRAAQAELDAALAEVKAQEDAYNARTEELKRKSEEGGVVSRNRAKNELAQHLAEDPLPLRRAKITAEAAAKRNERAVAAAAEARVAAAAAKQAADAALEQAIQALNEAEAYIKQVSATAGGGAGALWWIERELHEQRKYLPESRGGIRK
jgi:myosin heavy subunit